MRLLHNQPKILTELEKRTWKKIENAKMQV
jgi:hypothetical protein